MPTKYISGTITSTIFVDAIHDTYELHPDTIVSLNNSPGISVWPSIDANTRLAGDQKFTFIGAEKFHNKAGELRYQKQAGNTFLYGDVNGDGKADLVIAVGTGAAFVGTDFVL